MKNRAFMLIELAVAAFVIGVAIFALLGIALRAERIADELESETIAAEFAKEVFTTTEIYSDYFSEKSAEKWTDFWHALTNNDDGETGLQSFDGAEKIICDGTLCRRGEKLSYTIYIAPVDISMNLEGKQIFTFVSMTIHVRGGTENVPENKNFFATFAYKGAQNQEVWE